MTSTSASCVRCSASPKRGRCGFRRRNTRSTRIGFLAQHLVVLLDPDAIVANMHQAYRHEGFFTARYAVFMTVRPPPPISKAC